MNFRDFATSEFGTRLWMGLGRTLPPHTGLAVARSVAAVLSRRRDSPTYQAVRANQAALRGGAIGEGELDRVVHAVFHHAGKVSYDLVRLVAKGDDAIRRAITISPEAWADIEAARAGGRGVMMCGPHLSNFNLAFLGFALSDIPLLVLLAAATGGYTLVQQMISQRNLEAQQVSPSSLRQAVRRLRGGGMALTGVDWPEAPGDTEWLSFFGRPARLPTGHIRLAMSANARLLCVGCRWDPGTGYRVLTAPPLDLELTGDRAADVTHNARRVLAIIQGWIAERPEQWLMYYPVWKDACAGA